MYSRFALFMCKTSIKLQIYGPRQSDELFDKNGQRAEGALTFYIAWIILLFFWSIPIILAEYAIGRFTRNSVPVAFFKFFGKHFIWVGGWLVATIFFLSAYYAVIIGWCIYYFYISCTVVALPSTEDAGLALFNDFARNSYWPLLTQLLAILLTSGFLFGGIRWIERANLFLVPLLLLIIVFTFVWSLTRDYAEVGIAYLFTPSWESLANPGLWIAAAGQNAFDTSCGMASLMTYATFMGRSASIVRYSVTIPLINNLVR
ncbi:hypothetical protein P879_07884 [Paragonimus westermani]|uniref:Uncharacterized protein n=1 Tax=Paragonimus westermani TaxID=34504 RepID=A0A8T0DF74_9TREM|nr:hypothetical protein P879_07884 [Paragonimus westermani]